MGIAEFKFFLSLQYKKAIACAHIVLAERSLFLNCVCTGFGLLGSVEEMGDC